MNEFDILLLFVFVCSFPCVIFGGYGICLATNGRNGVCISSDECISTGGISDPANLCPGDSSIQV